MRWRCDQSVYRALQRQRHATGGNINKEAPRPSGSMEIYKRQQEVKKYWAKQKSEWERKRLYGLI